MRWQMIGMVTGLALTAGHAAAQAPGDAAKRAVQDAERRAVDPAPRAQVLAPHDYLVFFRGDAAELSPTAQVVVAKAAAAVKQTRTAGQLGHVKVIGYSDAVSTPDAARRLSAARAEVVKQALVAEGVAAELMRTEGRGKPRTAGKTDEVRELKNRRARIVLYGPGR